MELDIDWDSKLTKFRRICGTIHRYLKNKERKDTRMKFYKTVGVPTFLYASETWTLGKRDVQRIQAAKMKFLRGTQGCSLLDRRRNEDIRRDLNIASLHQKIEDHRRRWCEHLNCMPDIRLPVATMDYHPTGKRDVGRPRRRWVPEQV